MKTLCRNIPIIFLGLLMAGCRMKFADETSLPYYNGADFTPIWVPQGENIPDSIHRVDEFAFTDQTGKSISNKDYEGKIYAANFFFTSCPSICPVMTKNIKKVQDEFSNEDDVMFASYSVTPDIDSVARLNTFAKTYNIEDSKWHLMTGNKAEIYNLAWYSFFADEDPGFSQDSSEFIHSEHVLLVDKSGYIRGVYNGTLALDMERMSADIKVLKEE